MFDMGEKYLVILPTFKLLICLSDCIDNSFWMQYLTFNLCGECKMYYRNIYFDLGHKNQPFIILDQSL